MVFDKLIRCLIFVNIIPVKVHNIYSIEFKFFSWRTLQSFLLCTGMSVTFYTGSFLMYPTSVTFSGEGVTEWMSFVLYGVFHIAVFPSLPVVLGYSMASIPQITFEYKMKCTS